MESARHLVGVIVEFPASVQNRHNHLGRRYALLMHISRYTSTVVRNRDGFIRVDHNGDFGTVARESLVN